MPRRTALAGFVCVLIGTLALTASASAAVRKTVSAGKSVDRSCHTRDVSGAAGTDAMRVTASKTGLVRARLRGRGDWDLGVFDAKSGRSVAGSAGPGSRELAEGFVNKGERLLVQACRFGGRAGRASVSVQFVGARPGATAGKTQIVDVSTPTRADKRRLQGLGLDLTEHGDANSVEVVTYGDADARKLRQNGFTYRVRIADLAARERANRRANSRYAAQVAQSDLPSGRDSYRRLPDYDLEMKELTDRYPNLVRPITLNHRTHQGRYVTGIEITRNADNLADGKPVFLIMGTHHAREWPSTELTLEFAYDLLTNYGSSGRTTRLVNTTRTIVIPVVNADGFNISREGALTPENPFGRFSYEMKRKNCWPDPAHPGACQNNPTAGRLLGVDPNRNYGGLWGGAGATVSTLPDTFRGTGPFSEPETQNIRELVSARQVTNLITNHTFSNLVLRPPGVADMGFPHEEPLAKELGQRMADHNGYRNIPGFGLYDTTGTTEDWTFWSTGGFGYTFEIGPTEFHPPYETGVVAEYLGRDPAAGAGKGGNQAAFYEMLEATADQSLHSVLTGRAPAGTTLEVRKDFMTSTSPVWQDDFGVEIGPPMLFPDALSSQYRSRGGRFEFHMNPSTRPVVAGRFGREPNGPPQEEFAFENPAGIPAENTGYPEGEFESIPFTVQGPPAVDNGKMTVHIEWSNPNTDWDLYVVNSEGEVVTQSASFGDTTEDASLFDPPPGDYVAHVVNYDQVQDPPDDWTNGNVTFESPTPPTYGPTESWTFNCLDRRGRVLATREVTVLRGQRVDLQNACRNETQAQKRVR